MAGEKARAMHARTRSLHQRAASYSAPLSALDYGDPSSPAALRCCGEDWKFCVNAL